MIFRAINGKLININRFEFKNDKIFYKSIMDIMDIRKNFSTLNDTEKNKNGANFSNYIIYSITK